MSSFPSASPSSLLALAASAFNRGDVTTADELCQQLIRADRTLPQAWILLGRLRTRQARWREAEEALAEAQRLGPKDPEAVFSLAVLRIREGRLSDAVPLLETTRTLAPNHAGAKSALASCLTELGQAARAIEMIGTPNSSDSHLALAVAHVANQDDASAEPSLRMVIRLQQNAAARYQAHQLLGQLLERRGDFAGAFAEFTAARAVTPVRFDIAELREHVRRLTEAFSAEAVGRLARSELQSERPVFIVGMPRSGTTLVEKMIASHPRGAGAGETEALRRQADLWSRAKASGPRWPEVVRVFDSGDLDAIAKAYLGATDAFAGEDSDRVADKNLRNWLLVGLMALAFPKASIIRIRRDPFDTGLSCFERLNPASMPWSATLEGIGEALALHERLMEHWNRVFPGRFIDVAYEDLVRRPREVAPRLIEAIGLPWDEACLRQHERQLRPGIQEPPPTLAADQVRRPIYDTSIGRAARFGAVLDPLRLAYERAKAV